VNLRKENQTLKLKAHMQDEQELQYDPIDRENIGAVSIERIKELETKLKNKELESQDRLIEQKGQINELQLDNKSKEKNIETLNTKIRELLEEIGQLKRLSEADEATKLRNELKAAREKIDIMETELTKTTKEQERLQKENEGMQR